MPRNLRLLLPIAGLVLIVVAFGIYSASRGGSGSNNAAAKTPTPIDVPLTAEPPSGAKPLAPGDVGYPFRGDTPSSDQLHVKAMHCLAEDLLELQTTAGSYYITLTPGNNLFCSSTLPSLLAQVTTDANGNTVALDKKRFGIRLFEDDTETDPDKRLGINLIWDPGPLIFYRTPSVLVQQ